MHHMTSPTFAGFLLLNWLLIVHQNMTCIYEFGEKMRNTEMGEEWSKIAFLRLAIFLNSPTMDF